MNTQELTIKATIGNIIGIYNQANADELRAGLTWYKTAEKVLRTRKDLRSYPIWKTAAVTAALSPRMPWDRNISATATVLKAVDAGLNPSDVKVTTFHANKDKAFEIAQLPNSYPQSEALAILRGPKTCAFMRNLSGDMSCVTVDGHATNIALGTSTSLDNVVTLTKTQYLLIEALYIEAASRVGVEPAQMQAITWVTYRRLRGLN